LPDSVKATALIATVQLPAVKGRAKAMIGIRANEVSLEVLFTQGKCQVRFAFPSETPVVATGLDVGANHSLRVWEFAQEGAANYQLLIASAGDSAENFMLYSGYIYFPKKQKWKLVGTCRLANQWTGLKTLSSFTKVLPLKSIPPAIGHIWCQRSNGGWKPLSTADAPAPVLLPFSSTDSVRQFALDSMRLQADMASGRTDVKYYQEGVYYAMMKVGDGKPVALTDTVSIFYKGYLYANGKVFDQTKDKPARFPLARLIKGWQLGVPLCRVGGKIKLVILSGQAYGIRTRAAKIPPNSILVFEIEVLKSEE
jgi:FKBP-type peptidyl-prolyl cis-trans isomerase FkpA